MKAPIRCLVDERERGNSDNLPSQLMIFPHIYSLQRRENLEMAAGDPAWFTGWWESLAFLKFKGVGVAMLPPFYASLCIHRLV